MRSWVRTLLTVGLCLAAPVCAVGALIGIAVIATNGEIMSADSGPTALDWLITLSFGCSAIGCSVWAWRLIR